MNKNMITVEIQNHSTEETDDSDDSDVEDNDEELFDYLFESFLERRNTVDLTLMLPKDLL